MQTVKTALVVVLLLFVLYGGFVAINGSNNNLNPELEALVELTPDTPDISGGTGPFTPTPSANSAGDPWANFNSAPAGGFGSTASPEPAIPSPFGAPPAPSQLPPADAQQLPPLPPSLASNSPFPPLPDLPNSASTPPSLPPPAALLAANPKEEASDGDAAFGIALPPPPSKGAEPPKTEVAPEPKKEEPSVENEAAAAERAAKAFENAKENALAQAKKGQLKEALASLSLFYSETDLTTEQRQDLLDFLDALAREVVYSRQHLLDIPYFPVPGETVDQVATKFDVPVDILARINGLTPGSPIPPGTNLKVVPGPFRAEVDLNRNELTLFVGELYAGRYPVSVGAEPAPKAGDFKVVDKQKDRNYYGEGAPIPGNDPKNPYGGYWIDLGNDLSIHGTAAEADAKLGCISLSPQDAADVFGMLSHGSPITIVR